MIVRSRYAEDTLEAVRGETDQHVNVGADRNWLRLSTAAHLAHAKTLA